MAGTDPPKNLISLIRDFASEKSQGERRVVGLKKQIEDLRSELEAANAEHEEAKRLKETTEQELKGFEFELALNKASVQALEARISHIQDEISTVGSEVEELKNKEAALRDEFISQMVEFNTKIRKFQETIDSGFQNKNTVGNAAEEGHKFVKKEVTEIASRTIEDQVAHILSQIAKEEEEYLAQQNIQKQFQLELIDTERKVCLMEAMMQETKALEDLTGYPNHICIWNYTLKFH
ncbi:myosin-11 [Durio zibethinus]|uniref:Myosin-11 n=1 Tax=Durio zibethinus TaxID=66656 RepID=A0A6P5ZE43_DURZI|nr:myosin-11 [Durio zibethinus]